MSEFEPSPGTFHINATEVAAFASDADDGELQGKRIEGDGNAEVMAEVQANQAQHGEAAGVTLTIFTLLMTAHGRIKVVDKFIQSTRKLLEILVDTRAIEVDRRERVLFTIAETVDRYSKLPGNKWLLGKYKFVRAYRSAIGDKAAKTRVKNKKAALEAAELAAAAKAAAASAATKAASPTIPPASKPTP